MHRASSLPVALAVAFVTSCASGDPSAQPAPPSTTADAADAAAVDAPAPDPARWRTVAALTTARIAHTATLLDDGRVLVVGGEDETQRMLASTEIFDPKTEQWHEGPKLPAPRSNHVAVRLSDGRVLVAGGGKSTPTGQPRGERVMNDALLFDPGSETFAAAPPMQDARSHFEAVRLASGDVLVVGGGSARQDSPADCGNAPYCGPFGVALASAEVFEASANRWKRVGAMTTARNSFALAPLPDGRAMAIGGVSEKAVGYRSTEIFDPSSATWSAGPELKAGPREHHEATTTGSGVVFVVGGKNPNVTPLATTERLDAPTGAWRLGPLLGEPRTGAALVRLQSGRILVVGGFAQLVQLEGHDGSVREAFVYDDATDRLTPIAPLAAGRVLHSATLLADGRVLVAGGNAGSGALTSVEIGEP